MSKTKKLTAAERKERNKKIEDYLVSNPQKLKKDYEETARKYQATPEIIRHIARRLRVSVEVPVEVAQPEFQITAEIEKRKENAQIKSLKKDLEHAVKQYEALSDAYDIALNLKNPVNFTVPKIDTNSKVKSEATAIIQISDGHFEKIILPSTVNDLNEYNPDIARKRMEKCAENSLKLIHKERAAVKLDSLLLILGGDFIDNSQLHQGGEMTTAYSPMEAVFFAKELLSKYIATIREHGGFKKIIVACVRGNHPRITKKMSAAIDYKMNYEFILYNILKDEFKSKEFEWHIPDSEVAEVYVYDKMIRIIHGMQIRYQGGIGGITIPLTKYIHRLDAQRPAFHNFIHHFHTLSYPMSKATINGSVCGLDPYAFSLGCTYEPAQQSFQLLDREKGMTIKTPIFCE